MSGPNETDYIAYHGNIFLKGCIDSHKTGMRIQINLEREKDYVTFKSFNKLRKGKAGSGLYRVWSKMEGFDEWYGPVDLKFIRWNMSSANGAVITFYIDDPVEWKKMREGKAIDAGYRLDELNPIEMIIVELDNEGQPVNVKQRAKLEAYARKKKWGKGGPQSIRAARLCGDPAFLAWLAQTTSRSYSSVADIADWMRRTCELDTRAQLDHDPASLERFEARVARPFLRSQMH